MQIELDYWTTTREDWITERRLQLVEPASCFTIVGASVRQHVAFFLGETCLYESRFGWRRCKVVDRTGRPIGRVKDVIVDVRSVDQAAEEDGDGNAWGVRAAYAAVSWKPGLGLRFRRPTVLIPVSKLDKAGRFLRFDGDLESIRFALAA